MDRARAWQRLTFPFPFVHHQSREEIHYPVQILVLRDKNSLENIFGIACLYYLTNEDETDVEPHLITGLFTHGAANKRLRDQAIDSEEVVTPLMLDGTYLSRNSATLGPLT